MPFYCEPYVYTYDRTNNKVYAWCKVNWPLRLCAVYSPWRQAGCKHQTLSFFTIRFENTKMSHGKYTIWPEMLASLDSQALQHSSKAIVISNEFLLPQSRER